MGEDGGFFVYNNALYFNGYDAVSGGEYVYRLDAGSATPTRLTDGFGHDVGHTFLTPANFYQYDPAGGLFFIAHSTPDGADVLYLNQNGTILVPHSNGQPFTGAGLQNGFIGFNGNLYFSANDHLYKFNQFTGVSVVAGVDGTAGEHGGFVVFNNKLYFFAEVGGTTQLMSLDAAGQLAPVAGISGSFSGDAHFTLFDGVLSSRARPRRASSWCRSIPPARCTSMTSAPATACPARTAASPATSPPRSARRMTISSTAPMLPTISTARAAMTSSMPAVARTQIRHTVGQGRDVVDGGAGLDTLHVSGTEDDEAYVVWTVAAYNAAHPGNPYAGSAQILVTVNGAILDELTDVEQIAITGNGGTDSLDFQGDFTGTPLRTSNIGYGGGAEADTVDLSHAVLDNWVFADGGEGADSAILGFAFHGAGATYQQILDGNGALIGARITHTVGGQQVIDEFTGFESFVFTDGTRTLPLLFDEAPVATPDQRVGGEDTTLSIALASLAANDTDAGQRPACRRGGAQCGQRHGQHRERQCRLHPHGGLRRHRRVRLHGRRRQGRFRHRPCDGRRAAGRRPGEAAARGRLARATTSSSMSGAAPGWVPRLRRWRTAGSSSRGPLSGKLPPGCSIPMATRSPATSSSIRTARSTITARRTWSAWRTATSWWFGTAPSRS